MDAVVDDDSHGSVVINRVLHVKQKVPNELVQLSVDCKNIVVGRLGVNELVAVSEDVLEQVGNL